MKRITAVVLALCMLLGLAACGSSGTSENTPVSTSAEAEKVGMDVFDFSLAEYIGSKTYEETLVLAGLSEDDFDDAAYLGGGQAFDRFVEYNGEQFQLCLGFCYKGDPAEDPTLYLAEVDYRCLYEDISDTDAILLMIKSLYDGLTEKYGEPGEDCQDDILPALEAGNFDAFENNNKVFTQSVKGRDDCRYGLSVSAPLPTQIQLSVFFRLDTGI